MPKKKTNKAKPETFSYYNDYSSDHLKNLESLLRTLYYRRCRELRYPYNAYSGIIYSDAFYSGTTKSWLTDSRRCRTQRYPQLVELPTDYVFYRDHSYGCPPPSALRNINKLLQYTSRYYGSYSLGDGYNCNMMLTGVSNPAFMVCISPPNYWEKKNRNKERVITHKSTEIDPYDANSQVMKTSYVIRSKDGKYYAVSSQGAFFVMEKTDGNRIIITGICGTRAVPSNPSTKYFREYLIESRGEILLVFLIFKESTLGLAYEIEVLKFDNDTLKLVKVDRLKGRALFLENNCCIWVDSREIGCKSDCVYFTGGSGDGWWMYDMKTGSISDECVDIPGIED